MSGYVMVDCKKLNLLSQESQTIDGLYKKVSDAVGTNKEILAVNCEYGEGVPITPISVMVIEEAGVLICTSSILQVRVSSDDSVVITPLIS